MSRRRAFVVVLDACGAGALPDAADYGDPGADTLGHLGELTDGLELPHLQELGLGSAHPVRGIAPASAPVLHGRVHPLGPGKESVTGHWELMGVVPPEPLPTYPEGFPAELVDRIRAATGREYCLNAPANGIAAIDLWGEHHLATGELILYTSQDSVLQVAAHTDRVGEAELRELCRAIRGLMTGPHAVGRVIARPFTGPPGRFRRTEGRKDFSLRPPGRSVLEHLQELEVPVHAVGKVDDLFAHVGIDEKHPGATNAVAIASTDRLIDELEHGLVFTNLIETDQLYGHRKDVEGFHGALRAIDQAVGGWLGRLGPDDLLVLTADHGLDVTMPHSDHTREHAFLLARFAGHGGRRHDGPMADVGQSVAEWLTGAPAPGLPGRSFAGPPGG